MKTVPCQNNGFEPLTGEIWRQTEKDLLQTIASTPNCLEALYDLGLIFSKTGRLAEAEQYFRRIIALKPHFPEAYNNLGLVLSAMNRLGQAQTCFRQAIKLMPDCAEAYNNLGILQAKKKLAARSGTSLCSGN